MSADNVITVLETPRAAGEGYEYRVAEHGDSGCPLDLVCTEWDDEGEPTKWESRLDENCGRAMGWVVACFGKSPVYLDHKSAYEAARQMEEEWGFVEYGIQRHRLPMSFETMIREAPLERYRARHRRRHRGKKKPGQLSAPTSLLEQYRMLLQQHKTPEHPELVAMRKKHAANSVFIQRAQQLHEMQQLLAGEVGNE